LIWQNKYKLPHTLNKETKLAKKSSTVCSTARGYLSSNSKGFNKDNVLHYFDLSESSIAKCGITHDKIFNVYECGFNTVQIRLHKIVAQEGEHQVGVVAIGGRGVCIPPMTISKAKKME
jgi:hypothetical protein